MKKLYFLVAFSMLFCKNTEAQTDSFLVDGVYRNYILHLPNGYNSSKSYPLVFNLHGYTSTAFEEELYTNFDATADSAHFIVVYPNGINFAWNVFNSGPNDVKFIANLIDTLEKRYAVNSNRVYSCGMSMGGFMSYHLACNLSNRIAAIASVTGVMSNYTLTNCNPTRKVPTLDIHGTTDPVVNYALGITGSVGVEQTINYWRNFDGCTSPPDTTFIPNTNLTDGSDVQAIHYKNCIDKSEVLFYKVNNGGHTWPSMQPVVLIPTNGNTNQDFFATRAIWDFFNRHALDGTSAINELNTEEFSLNIFPNPTISFLEIKTSQSSKIEIYNSLGELLYNQQEEKIARIDIANFPKGIYLLKTNNISKVFVKE